MAFTNTREAVTAIFIGYYDRAPAPNGLNYWVEDIDTNGFSVADVARAFAVVPETQAAYPGLTTAGSGDLAADVAFVTAVFNNLFGRDPNNITENGGADNFWVAALQGGADVGQLIIDIISGAQGDDLAIIQNKIAVGLAYADASEDAGELTRNDLGDTVLDDVDSTQSSVDEALEAIEDEFPEEVIPGETFRLTTENDSVAGTANADTFEAEDGEMNSGDQLDGGAGRDTLTIFNESNGVAVSPRATSVEQVVMTNQANDLSSVADNNVGGYNTSQPINAFFANGDQDFDSFIEDHFILDYDYSDFGNGDDNFFSLADIFDIDTSVEVDVEIDGGRMVGVDRWEDFDSRADVVIEDARDDDDTDGTFTGDITVAMVSTDPGNVDFAVYFDQPVNTSANDDVIFIEVIDQNNSGAFNSAAITGATEGNLTDAQLTEFSILIDGVRTTIELDTDVVGTQHFGANATYTDLLNAINTALDNTTLADGTIAGDDLTATLGTTFDENIGDDNAGAGANSQVFGLQIVLRSDSGRELGDAGAGDIVVISQTDPADTAQSITNQENVVEELIRLNVELDDVGKGSMGGDALFGAMSTGRQAGDDGTSDSLGIQQFDIKVDRSSQLQTINSTNNSLEVVNIENGENDGPNNTTTAADEEVGDLVVRGVANPSLLIASDTSDDFGIGDFTDNDGNDSYYAIGNAPSSISTDGPMPGGVPQHNAYGFSDVRVINGATMIGALDITAELTEEVVEKYMQIQDGAADGEADDVAFTYTMGTNDDEFFLNMSADALDSAGTGSREDFDMTTSGGAGDDVLTTNVGRSLKLVDEQGQDHYVMLTENDEEWYENSVFSNASTFTVNGGSGNDTIWTHGWGDKNITDGSGTDAVYTDNSGVEQLFNLATNIDRNLLEHDPIDYVFGAVWAFNAELSGGDDDDQDRIANISGATNDEVDLGSAGAITATTLTSATATITVSFTSSQAADLLTAYTATATIPFSEISVSGGRLVTDEQAYNQAIKNAINSDPVLSQVLEAADGPGNSLVVYSKIDGDFDAADLLVETTGLVANNSALTPVAAVPSYTGGAVLFSNEGSDSDAESDSSITVSADGENDVFVLSTNDGGSAVTGLNGAVDDPLTDLDGASNETLRIVEGDFGSDTVFNFDALGFDTTPAPIAAAAGDGHDVIDFLAIAYDGTAFSGGPGAGFSVTDDSISVVMETAANDEASDVATAYAGLAAGDEAIAIVYDAADDNTGTVYLVTGAGTGADDASVFLHGEISLIGTNWADMTAENFA